MPPHSPMSTARDRRARLWDRWLCAAIAAVIAYGTVLVVHGRGAATLFDVLGFGPTASGVSAGEGHVQLLYGVLGAVLIGWMVLLLAVARGPLRRRERWAWTATAASMTVWFGVDTTFSLVVGSTAHAAFNCVFAAAVGVPLVAMRGYLADVRLRG
ncbi:hypothetical protein AB0M43_06820 [Longispora sp. NPDC051575]|uniref:hypothetical protein n=1 Tax=Longispora sp. NPDC051575 TaxID=3154943 RepID=UPI00341B654A